MRRILNTFIVFALVASTALADSDAGRESVFSVGVGGRALGMGGGFTSLADDATSVYFNPAGLGLLEYQELTFMHMDLFEGTKLNFGSWVAPGKNYGVGIGYMRIGTDDLIRMQNFVPLGTFDYSQSQFLFSIGAKAGKNVAIGGTVKAVNQEIDMESDWAMGVDAGMIIMPHKNVRIGIAARDAVTPTIKLRTVEEETPTSVAGGIGIVKYPLSEQTKFSGSVEFEKFGDRTEKIHTGGELLFDDTYAIRGGYDRDNVSLGVGYAFRMFSIDYAYKILDYVDNSHRISFSLRLGEIFEPVPDEEEEFKPSLPPTAGAVPYEFSRQFKFYKDKADDYYKQSKLDSALMYYKRALDFEPGNTEIKNKIDMISHALLAHRPAPPVPMVEEKPRTISNGETAKIIGLYLAQSRSFYNEGFYAPALELLKQILVMDPIHQEAKKRSVKITREIEQNIDNHLKEAKSAESSGDYSKAVDAYTRILELNPAYPQVRENRERLFKRLSVSEKLLLGIKNFDEGMMEQARGVFESVLVIDSTNAIAKSYLTRISNPEVKPAVEPKLSATPAPTPLEVIQADAKIWPHYLDGLKFMRDKEYQKAIDSWMKVLEVYPNSPDTKNNISQARLRLQAEQ